MKILWASNSPLIGSGYGVQSALFGPRIAALGHDLSYYANYGHEGSCLTWNGANIYPSDGAWGNRTLVACAAHHADGLEDCQVIALCDAWVLKTERFQDELRLALWAPVDHQPLPPISREVLAHRCVTPLAMSRFGERMMQAAGLDPLYVPHCVDTNLFRPRPDERAEIRAEFGLPAGAFVVGMVAANKGSTLCSRKAFPQVFQAFARFRETHRDAFLYVHSNEIAEGGPSGGIHLRPLANACGIPASAIRFTEQFAWDLGVTREDVARLMSTFDVLASPSFGEGFGVPIVEAQACGVPVVVTDHSSMPELCGAGWLVDGDGWYDGPQDSWFRCPSISGIADALGEAYGAWGTMGDAARSFALAYDVDAVTETYWRPVLERLDVAREVGPLVREAVMV